MIIESIASFFIGIGFGIIFNIKGKRLIVAGIGGGIAWFSYKFSLHCIGSDVISYFISAICFSIYCEICARIYKTPATTLSVCCLIPLVPGYGVYNTMYQFIVGDYMKAIEYGVNTLAISGALALGIIFVSTIFRNIKLGKFIGKSTKNKNNSSIKSGENNLEIV
ncbi:MULTISPECIES: threonine/serine exporter family protein [Romboutsia]|uniref:Membrane spanning protein n=1 Tax=Romboutsia hominis TaxID=1507512 RepID=A0A2P2BSQ2_9FIRM|nr:MULTISPECIES: threonine/serine exporter family protein [Romboutsia]MCH1960684.1 threonine/serine exporter family protein [Romboutsia hominis]MCH1968884.1 threonine/serine exporter family protein [Romboutsia hominis]MDB8791588.1 threonine/serine exporter family protein [Romboutsia sp. 1001216sp1]MDB8793596.1 threonine/serine exporter family protein [Romboutsia sp. 1001216sp1]MDB8794993.1 threonine/serine exporter family protein [Romboutsia sp. 1001216sp1]